MRDIPKAVAVAVVVLGLAVAAWAVGGDLGSRSGSPVASAAQVADMPTPLIYNTAPPVTLAPVPPPTPSYNYVWDATNPTQCFNPSDPNLPTNAPRCPPRVVPPDPGGPTLTCPPGTTLVYPNHQPTCLPTKP